ncbi:2,3-bisphosphoglycerate-independent phosphoglycerate mutase [Dehalococcoidia bacterium]|nr:2,3-bisphosphoglycerate-independent phosphoglycerate mutase [Dehalococcoidia bacterium]
MDFPYLNDLCLETPSKIILLVVDGLGGLPDPDSGRSELETAHLPNLDLLAQRSACGLTTPVVPGITPGSGPGHMALFGYDPVKYLVGRGVLEALGINVELGPDVVAARGNFCSVDDQGRITDRRAGRITSAESATLIELLKTIEHPGVSLEVYPVQDYRFVLLLRGDGLGASLPDTDPQSDGVEPRAAIGLNPESNKTAAAVNTFVGAAAELLKSRESSNMVLLRGFSREPNWPGFGESYRLNPGAVAAYPMYRGISKLMGMTVLQTGQDFDAELDTVADVLDDHDFIFLHYKPADAAGEDGNFKDKVARLQELDERIPRLVDMGADTLVVAGDHSTPAAMAGHSWHPVPLMVSSQWTVGEGSAAFTERQCGNGVLGRLAAMDVMLLSMAHAGKLSKFGA